MLDGEPVLHFWDRSIGKDRLATPDSHRDAVWSLSFVNQANTLVSVGRDQTARFWDLASGKSSKVVSWNAAQFAPRISARGISAGIGWSSPGKDIPSQRQLMVWKVETGERIRAWPIDEDMEQIIGLALSPDASTVTTAAIQDPQSQALRSRTSLEFAHDGQSLAFVRKTYKPRKPADAYLAPDNTIVWLDSHTGHPRREIEFGANQAGTLAFSPDAKLIAAATSGTRDNTTIRVFRLRDKREVQTIDTQSEGVSDLKFTPDGTRLAVRLSDSSIVLWKVHSD